MFLEHWALGIVVEVEAVKIYVVAAEARHDETQFTT
jgi:hypothetical protein